MKRIVVVDSTWHPLFPVWKHVTSCEAADELLENVAVDELWIREDPQDVAGIASLIDLLIDEANYEGRMQVGTVVVVGDINIESEIERRLAGIYEIRREPFVAEQYVAASPTATR